MGSCFGFPFGVSPLPRLGKYARTARVIFPCDANANAQSVWSGAFPTVKGGDYASVEQTAHPSEIPLAISSTGMVVSNMSGVATKQNFLIDHYSRARWQFTGDTRQYWNNHRPAAAATTLQMVVSVPFPATDFKLLFTDADADQFSVSYLSGDLPLGSSISGSVLNAFVPIRASSGSFIMQGTDGLEVGLCSVTWIISVPTGDTAGSLTEFTRVKSTVGGGLVG